MFVAVALMVVGRKRVRRLRRGCFDGPIGRKPGGPPFGCLSEEVCSCFDGPVRRKPGDPFGACCLPEEACSLVIHQWQQKRSVSEPMECLRISTLRRKRD